MKNIKYTFGSLLIAVVSLAFSTAGYAASVTNQKIAVPAYFYPTLPDWTSLENGAPTVEIAVMNPNSGPGNAPNSDYQSAVISAKSKGIAVIGYVYTSYGSRNTATVESEIDRYYTWYNVDGIFLDETSSNCSNISYYQTIYNYIKAKPGAAKVVINPGLNVPECYINVSDVLINFEDNYTDYVNWKPLGWEYKYHANRFWQLVYAAKNTADMQNSIALSKKRNAGYIYVTHDDLPNPWDTLPPYWSNELSLVAQNTFMGSMKFKLNRQ